MSHYAGTPSEPLKGAPSRLAKPSFLTFVAGLLALAVGLGALLLTRPQTPGVATRAPRSSAFRELGQLPLLERAQISSAAGAGSAGFAIRPSGPGTLAGKGRGFESTFSASAAKIRSARTELSFSKGLLDGDVSSSVGMPRASGNRVTYEGSSLSEWYANGPAGLEQGFDVSTQPSAGAELRIEFTVTGSKPELHRGVVSFGGGLSYGGLSATAAEGRPLPAKMRVQGHRIVLLVNASGARFPVEVDPIVSQQTLETGEIAGTSIAISGDGRTAVVGPSNEAEPGAVNVFVRSGTVWTLQQRLSPGGGEGRQFGASFVSAGAAGTRPADGVALSGDGNTAMIDSFGGVWTYTRTAGIWTADKKTLPNNGISPGPGTLALSYNGETAAIGSAGEGPVLIYSRTASGWKKSATFVDPTGFAYEDLWGYGIALSGNGRQLAIGAPGTSGSDDPHLIYFFGEEAGKWSSESVIEYTGYGELLPAALALDREGDTAVIGEPDGEPYGGGGNVGAARVYTRAGKVWALQQTLILEGEDAEAQEVGNQVGLSEDGKRAIVQAYGGNIGPLFEGSVDLEFTRSGSTWSQQGGALAVHGSFEGESALSGEGHTLLVSPGGNGDPVVYVNQATVSNAVASEVKTTTALLTASVDPAGETVTSCQFEYGTTTAYGSTAACSPKPASQTTPVAVSAALKSLSVGVTYHFRAAVVTSAGTFVDSDGTFTTFKESATASTKESSKPATAQVGPLSAVAAGGTGSVTVGTYGSEPGTAPLPGSSGNYGDIYRSAGSTFTEVEYKDCEIGNARALWFYTTEGWVPARPAATFSGGCGYFTATTTSRPSVSELLGLRSKWGEPPGEYGQCHAGSAKIFTYSEGNCLTVAEKDGKATGAGKDEWFPVPLGCYPMKKGRYSEGECEKADESSKGKGEGSYEVGSAVFTGTTGTAKLTIAGASAVECSSGRVAGELTGPEKGTQTLALSGCSQSGLTCTSAQGLSGTIQTSPLEAISYEEESKYLLALTGVDLAQFTCGSNVYTLTGAVSGPQSGVVNAMSKKSGVAFASGEGSQLLVIHSGTSEHAAVLTMTESDASNQSLELDSAITSVG